jgi:hypothetical protein
MPTTDENKAKRDYVMGLLKGEPEMPDADLNYYLDKKKLGAMAGADILKIREELGYTVVGRGRGRKVVPVAQAQAAAAAPLTEQKTAAAAPVQTPAVTAQTQTVTRTLPAAQALRAQTPAEKEADDHLLADLVARIQQIMERENIVHIQIPRRGEITIHESQIVKRNLNPSASEGVSAPH